MPRLQYTPPAQPVCRFLKVEYFELRPPDTDDWSEPPAFPNAMPICTCTETCRYESLIYPHPWSGFDPQIICCGWAVEYTDSERTAWTVSTDPKWWWPHDPPIRPVPEAQPIDELELLREYFIPPHLREEFRSWERKWGYAGAVAYLSRTLAGKHTPAHTWHWPAARIRKASIDIWHVGRHWPAKPDQTLDLGEFIREALPPSPPAGEQLTLF